MFDRKSRPDFKIEEKPDNVKSYEEWYFQFNDFWLDPWYISNDLDGTAMNIEAYNMIKEICKSWNSCIKTILEMQKRYNLPKNPENFTKENMLPICPCFSKCFTEYEAMNVVHKGWSEKQVRDCYDRNANLLLFYRHVEYARVIYKIVDALQLSYDLSYAAFENLDYWFKEGEGLPPYFDNSKYNIGFATFEVDFFGGEQIQMELDKDRSFEIFGLTIPHQPKSSEWKFLRHPYRFIKMYTVLDQLYYEAGIINPKNSPGMIVKKPWTNKITKMTHEQKRKLNRETCYCYTYVDSLFNIVDDFYPKISSKQSEEMDKVMRRLAVRKYQYTG